MKTCTIRFQYLLCWLRNYREQFFYRKTKELFPPRIFYEHCLMTIWCRFSPLVALVFSYGGGCWSMPPCSNSLCHHSPCGSQLQMESSQLQAPQQLCSHQYLCDASHIIPYGTARHLIQELTQLLRFSPVKTKINRVFLIFFPFKIPTILPPLLVIFTIFIKSCNGFTTVLTFVRNTLAMALK